MAQALDDDGEYDVLALQEVWLNWDPAKEIIVQDSEAAELLGRPFRAPWHLG